MSKVLFINPPSRRRVYLNTNVSVGTPNYPNLTLATLAGHLKDKYVVKALDMDLFSNYQEQLKSTLNEFKPDIVVSSSKSPDFKVMTELIGLVKNFDKSIKIAVGGVHLTTYPDAIKELPDFDIAAFGEADYVLPLFLEGHPLRKIQGVAYRRNGEIITTEKRNEPLDLNKLPYPNWEIFNISTYKNSRLSSRLNPVGLIETSRGCAFQCNYCNKLTFGSKYRTKEPKRVVEEMEYLLKIGFREIHIIDDSFTQSLTHAKSVCEEIINSKLTFPWSLINGIRVDCVDEEFFALAKKAGCWQVSFGIESGDQKVLDKIGKRTTVEKITKAVHLAKKCKLDTFGFFILGLSGDTKESIEKTITFAKSLPLDMAKFDIAIPYPGTPYYHELKAKNSILSEDFEDYVVHRTDKPLFKHENLEWDELKQLYYKAFRKYYLNVYYILRRIKRSFLMNDLIYDINYFIKSKWYNN
jgi:radical SAM superfamily enzyme YgiQ (UPF0313 family)